ncbi:hypothetical protein FIU97_19565 (plasmid) [Roseivivax sp. THAF40]|nr:hypothetical protein FIV09_18780 [Roseivivax sp. THAF197b]QFT48795.1 hypothetical protein FIU97_19565 [Roseivivax sp. THAF40]
MKITGLETIRIAERPSLIWVLVHTDVGPTGLRETFFGAAAVEAHVPDWIAPRVMGRDPLAIDALSSGVEMRGNSAFKIALWDLFGKATALSPQRAKRREQSEHQGVYRHFAS